jgi:hypothetical protein
VPYASCEPQAVVYHGGVKIGRIAFTTSGRAKKSHCGPIALS